MIAFPRDEIHDEDEALDWWEQRFAVSCEEMGAQVSAAALVRGFVKSLREIRAASMNATLSLTAAATESGYSAKQIGRWIRDKKIENAGTPTSPRVRRADIVNRKKPQVLPKRDAMRILASAQDIARSVADSTERKRDG